MAKRKVIWLQNAEVQMLDIMDYYYFRNKSMTYSLSLHKQIKSKLQSLDFRNTLPQKTSIENLFYFTHKHISVFFCIEDETVIIHIIWDDRRNPEKLKNILDDI